MPAGAQPATARPGLLVIADSVMLSAAGALSGVFPERAVEVVGRPAVFTDVAVPEYVAPRAQVPDVVVVATGYNYPFWDPARYDRSVDDMIAALQARGAAHVIWVTLREVKPQDVSASAWAQVQPYYWYFPTVNAHLRAARQRHPELILADWAAIADRPGVTYDAIHLNREGTALMGELLRREVDGFTRLPAGAVLEVYVPAVPAGGSALLNLTVTNPRDPGFVTVYPCGSARPTASNLNHDRWQEIANHVAVPPGPDGTVCVYSLAASHIVVDLAGSLGAGFEGIAPRRLLDTRVTGGGPVPAGGVVPVAAAGAPAGAVAAVIDLTAVEPDGPGYLAVFPCGGTVPAVSSVNHDAGQTVANLAVVPLSPSGELCMTSYTQAHVVVDLAGWFTIGGSFAPVATSRIVDTRAGVGGTRLGAGAVLSVAPPRSSPAAAAAAAITLTVTAASADGYATVYPCDQAPPLASDLNYREGSSVAASTLATLDAAGRFCVTTSAEADVLVDLAGFVAPGTFTGITPTRLADTRAPEPSPPTFM